MLPCASEPDSELSPGLYGVVFDLDGTLTDTATLSARAFVEVVSQYRGAPVTEAEMQAMFGPNEEGIIRQLVPDRWQACLDEYLAFHHQHYERLVRPWPLVAQLLQALKAAGLPMAIVTARGPRSTRIVLDREGIEPYVDSVHCGEPHAAVKARSIGRVVASWASAPEAVVYVGDSPSDMRAARDAGVRPVGATWAHHASAEQLQAAGAERIFSTPAALEEWILGR